MKNGLWVFAIALLVLMFFLPAFQRMQKLKERDADYQRQIEYLKVKNKQLEEERRRLLEDPMYLEKVGREKMGIVKEGEVIYRITPQE